MNNTFAKFDLSGKSAVVTGGGRGIGYNISKALSEAGAKVVIASRDADKLKKAAAELSEMSGNEVLWDTVDLNNRPDVRAFAARAIETVGGVDIFVGNAAQDINERIEVVTDDGIDRSLEINVTSNIVLTREFLPHMRSRKWGRVIISGSVISNFTSPHEGVGLYSSVKGALNAFTRTAAAETGHEGVTVNSLVLGFFLTDLHEIVVKELTRDHGPEAGQQYLTELGAMSAIGRACECSEVEGVVQLLASDAGSAITGSNLVIDGGMSIMLRPNPRTDG